MQIHEKLECVATAGQWMMDHELPADAPPVLKLSRLIALVFLERYGTALSLKAAGAPIRVVGTAMPTV